MSAQNIATSLIFFFITKALSLKSVSLKEISKSVVFHFTVLFIFPWYANAKFKRNIWAVNMNLVKWKKEKRSA